MHAAQRFTVELEFPVLGFFVVGLFGDLQSAAAIAAGAQRLLAAQRARVAPLFPRWAQWVPRTRVLDRASGRSYVFPAPPEATTPMVKL